MSQEIVYTSAAQGLKMGSRGFCTVASTSGMASSLAERLESLSGYRHLYPPQDPQAKLNPVAYSHLILTVGGRRYHVVSRISDAGLDYSQRSNKLAHHVTFEAQELSPCGPAWCLAQPGFMLTVWNEAPRLLAGGRLPPGGELRARICSAWQAETGDAGWAGVLAQSALTNKDAYIIFAPGMQVLPLLVEAQSLLPAARRWEVSFSTFVTKLPPGVECRWRCVVANSDEALAAKRVPGATVIDLTMPLGTAPNGPLITAARTGILPVSHAPAQVAKQPLAVMGLTPLAPLDTTPDIDLLEEISYDLIPLAPLGGPPPPRVPLNRLVTNRESTRARWIAVIGGGVLTLLLTVGATCWAVWSTAGNKPPIAVTKPQQIETTVSQEEAGAREALEAWNKALAECEDHFGSKVSHNWLVHVSQKVEEAEKFANAAETQLREAALPDLEASHADLETVKADESLDGWSDDEVSKLSARWNSAKVRVDIALPRLQQADAENAKGQSAVDNADKRLQLIKKASLAIAKVRTASARWTAISSANGGAVDTSAEASVKFQKALNDTAAFHKLTEPEVKTMEERLAAVKERLATLDDADNILERVETKISALKALDATIANHLVKKASAAKLAFEDVTKTDYVIDGSFPISKPHSQLPSTDKPVSDGRLFRIPESAARTLSLQFINAPSLSIVTPVVETAKIWEVGRALPLGDRKIIGRFIARDGYFSWQWESGTDDALNNVQLEMVASNKRHMIRLLSVEKRAVAPLKLAGKDWKLKEAGFSADAGQRLKLQLLDVRFTLPVSGYTVVSHNLSGTEKEVGLEVGLKPKNAEGLEFDKPRFTLRIVFKRQSDTAEWKLVAEQLRAVILHTDKNLSVLPPNEGNKVAVTVATMQNELAQKDCDKERLETKVRQLRQELSKIGKKIKQASDEPNQDKRRIALGALEAERLAFDSDLKARELASDKVFPADLYQSYSANPEQFVADLCSSMEVHLVVSRMEEGKADVKVIQFGTEKADTSAPKAASESK